MMLEIDQASLALSGSAILDCCTLTVAAGEIVALAGPNGAGKTSLLSVASGHLVPDRGAVRIGGTPVDGVAPEQRAALGLGRCFQGGRVFDGLTVAQTLSLAAMHARRAVPWERPRLDGAGDLLELTGLASEAHRKGGELSFGQRKLLDLARALAFRPRLLLLDEPVAGVSPARRRVIERAIASYRDAGGAVLLVEHELATVRELADRMVFMAEGRILVTGPPAEVLADGMVRTIYLGGRL